MVRTLASMMLESLGYQVLVADSADDCIEKVRGFRGRIDLLLSDVIMPKMNGRELYTRLKDLRPDLKVLYMSGYSRNVIGNQGLVADDIPFIEKPFSMKALAAKIRSVIDPGGG